MLLSQHDPVDGLMSPAVLYSLCSSSIWFFINWSPSWLSFKKRHSWNRIILIIPIT